MCNCQGYAAHIRSDGSYQTVKEHSESTADLCREFSVDGFKTICYIAGLLHDVGKYLPDFQRKILYGLNLPVEHSICGAKAAIEKYGGEKSPLAILLALCIAGHHSGIPACGAHSETADNPSLFARLKRTTGSFEAYKNELIVPEYTQNELLSLISRECSSNAEALECFAFLVRYCFSCLVDADITDTIQAVGRKAPPMLTSDFRKCLSIVDTRLSSFQHVTELQKARALLQEQVFQNIQKDSEIYLMEMPTGSGKTLASIKCALTRALATGKKRIIYVIPYNSIIDQTAKDFERMFGDAAQILRHQSSFSYEDQTDYDEDYKRSAIYACENWNAQIIVTTAVQFFESVYSAYKGKLRKLHNMADSVIVFDEAHLMPINYLQPCLRSIAFITKYLHSEAIFLTATMPDFRTLIKTYALQKSIVTELVPDHSAFKYFKKNTYKSLGVVSDDYLIAKANEYASSLIVVNNRKSARRVYRKCHGEKYHLSTYMSGIDRERVIQTIRERLSLLRRDYPCLDDVPPERRIVVVSTSLIEAGVDLDFSAAFRELSGLDNALQTGGRSNREGIAGDGPVYMFCFSDTLYASNGEQAIKQNILSGIIREFPDISSDEAIKTYYERLLAVEKDDITRNSLSRLAKRIDSIPFRTYSDNLHLITSDAVSIVIPQDVKIRSILDDAGRTGEVDVRKLQPYCASVREKELRILQDQGAITEICGIYVLSNMNHYSKETGIIAEKGECFIV